ncbi:glycosyltransferase [Micromonospora humidisoli]|uniref:Glycosyltransferase n=1 Tax=Micromonospora humidisoli TaxID=2807622 RepID=A0ABS2JKS4_9ACTN|nr:glycosyltransferase [Micromonospora humidisoli]MBM7086479.1 glycosyltransferase [Micromonospora humidisoli]
MNRSVPRIGYVLARPPGLTETFVPAEIRAVRAAGATVEVFVVAPDANRHVELRRAAVRLLRRPADLPADLRLLGLPSRHDEWSSLARGALASAAATALAAEVDRFDPDVLHAHFVNLPTAVAVLLGHRLGRPVTATAHAADFLLDPNPVALRRRLSRLRHLFVVSAATADQLTDRGVPMSAIPHRIVRAAVDGRLLDAAPVDAPPEAVPGTPTRLVTVARLVPKKGVETAIDAVARLTDDGHSVRYDIYGEGPLRDDLNRRVTSAGLTEAVTLHGAVPHQVATTALAGADVAVLPCRPAPDGDLDGIPVFLMEAASQGIPVVTTAVSGIPELVGPGSGWLVPPDDPVALAAAIGAVVDDPGTARRRAGVLLTRLRSEFAPAVQADRLLSVWRDLAGTGPTSPIATPGGGHR